MKDFHAANVAILCREPVTIKSVFKKFNVSLFELSQLKIMLRSFSFQSEGLINPR